MDAKSFVMVYNEIEEQGGIKMHEHEAEQGYFVIEGKMLLRIGKEEREVEAGAAIYIPSGVPRSFRAVGKDKLQLIMIYSPLIRVRDKEMNEERSYVGFMIVNIGSANIYMPFDYIL
jgi:mannose-6-phosphate isomerase-like protein (cupin superfamily)